MWLNFCKCILCLLNVSPAIDAKKIKPNINESGHDLVLSWSNPETTVFERCYDTHIQFKSSCHANWTVSMLLIGV